MHRTKLGGAIHRAGLVHAELHNLGSTDRLPGASVR